MLGCCFVSFHFLWAILCPQAVLIFHYQKHGDKAHQFPVVEDPALVDVGELLGEGDGVLPVLATLQQVDHVQVQLLLALPLLLRRIPETRGQSPY